MDKHNIEKPKDKGLTDIALVAYLKCIEFKLKRIDKQKDKSVFFFEDNIALEEETLKYFNHEARVDPLQFSETLRNLRSYAKQ